MKDWGFSFVKTNVDGFKAQAHPTSTDDDSVTTKRTPGSLSTVTVPLKNAITVWLGGEVTSTLDGDIAIVTTGTIGSEAEHAGARIRNKTATSRVPRIASLLTVGEYITCHVADCKALSNTSPIDQRRRPAVGKDGLYRREALGGAKGIGVGQDNPQEGNVGRHPQGRY
jgi:hypothetical protein